MGSVSMNKHYPINYTPIYIGVSLTWQAIPI